jgi:hypothetical protein
MQSIPFVFLLSCVDSCEMTYEQKFTLYQKRVVLYMLSVSVYVCCREVTEPRRITFGLWHQIWTRENSLRYAFMWKNHLHWRYAIMIQFIFPTVSKSHG